MSGHELQARELARRNHPTSGLPAPPNTTSPLSRRSGVVRAGIAGALGYAFAALAAVVAQSLAGPALLSIASAASAVLLIGVVAGLGRSAIRGGRLARAGLWLTGVSWAMVGIAEVVSLVRGEDTAVLYVVATLLHIVGMVPVAIAAALTATFSAPLRVWPLVCLLYLILATPAFGQQGTVAELALAGWGTAWLVLAVLLPRTR